MNLGLKSYTLIHTFDKERRSIHINRSLIIVSLGKQGINRASARIDVEVDKSPELKERVDAKDRADITGKVSSAR